MSPIELENLHKDFGLKVTGIELNDSLSQDKILQIKEWIDDYSLVVFPRQHLNDEAHLEFTRKLGEPEPNHVSLGRDGVVNYFGTIGNVPRRNRKWE